MLILAIEPDKRQAAQVKAIVHSRLGAELILADSADHALKMLGDRVPDLILATALLSPKDETTLNDRLRTLERAALFVQTLTIPMLAAPASGTRGGGVLSVLRREKPKHMMADGCDPAVFADQIKEYLERAATEREHHAAALADAAEREREEAARVSRAAAEAVAATAAAEGPLVFDETPQSNVWGSDPEPSVWTAPAQAPVEAERSSHEPPPVVAYELPASTEAPIVEAVPVAVVFDKPPAGGANDLVVLQSEPTGEAPPEPEPRAVVIHAEFPGLQSQSAKQAWPLDTRSSHAEDEVPGADQVLVEMTHQPEPPVAEPPVVREVGAAPEPLFSKDEDLQIFDLDIDALVNGPAREEPVLDAAPETAAATAPAGGEEAPNHREPNDLASDDAEFEVYDLDLSSLVGEGAREAAPTDEPTPAAPAAMSVDVDSGSTNAPAAAKTTKVTAAAPHRDEDVDIYDLDLDFSLAMEQREGPPAAPSTKATPPSPRASGEGRHRGAQTERAPAPRPSATAGVEQHKVVEEPTSRSSSSSKGPAEPRPTVDVAGPPVEANRPIVDVEPPVGHAKPQSGEAKPPLEVERPVVEAKRPGVEEEPTRREIQEDAHHVIQSGAWAPLMTGAHRLWPRLEGGVAQQPPPQPPRLAVVGGPSDAPVVPVLPPRAPAGPKRPEWLNAIKALKRDSQPISIAPAADTSAPVEPPAPPRTETAHIVVPVPAQEPATADASAHSGPSRSKKRRPARNARKEQMAPNPIKADWGFVDPEDGGFSALVARLDEITSLDQ